MLIFGGKKVALLARRTENNDRRNLRALKTVCTTRIRKLPLPGYVKMYAQITINLIIVVGLAFFGRRGRQLCVNSQSLSRKSFKKKLFA